MHGELPKPVEAPTTRRGRRAIVTGRAGPGRARAALDLCVLRRRATAQPQRAAASPPKGRCRCCWRAAARADVPVYLDAVGTTQRAQHRHGAPAGRRQAAQRRFQGRRGRQEGRRAGAHRSDHLPGAARSGGRQEGAGRGAARQRQDRSRALREARRHQRRSTSSRPTPRRALVAQNAAQVQADQAAIDNAQAMLGYTTIIAPIDRPHRHPPGRRRQHRARLRRQLRDRGDHADHSRSPCCSTCRSRTSTASTTAFAKGPLPVDALRSDNDDGDRPRQAHRGRQPGRSDHRHGASSRPNFPIPTCSSGRASSSTCGC